MMNYTESKWIFKRPGYVYPDDSPAWISAIIKKGE